MKIEHEVIGSCPSGDVCQTFQEERLNVGVGGWERGEEQLRVVCVTVVREYV